MRLFLAFPLAPELQKRLHELQDELASADWSVRWTPVQNLHLTLHFLGETPENLLEDLHHDIGALASKTRPFDLRVGGVGAFPTLENPRIVWAGAHGNGAALASLFDACAKVLNAYRVFELKKEITPHLTLGRVEKLSEAWDAGCLTALRGQWDKLGMIACEELRLMQSTREKDGSHYEVLQQFRFNG